jgi:flavin reductase (DIM6/NTAB) family NADH-FMN oxidoreductase RutF
MDRYPIAFEQFQVSACALWEEQWLLLTSGDFQAGHFNTMTAGWGNFGVMWNKPFVQVFVRPVRYTFEFLERYETFTLCVLPQPYRSALQLIGAISGREQNKIAAAGITPCAMTHVAAPGFVEAELVLECQKMYWMDFEPGHFSATARAQNYPIHDDHRIYFGEILAISGVSMYSK